MRVVIPCEYNVSAISAEQKHTENRMYSTLYACYN